MKWIIRGWILCLLLMLPWSVTAQDEQDETVIMGEAFVNTVEITRDDGIVLNISGDLPNSCTEIATIEQTIDDDTIMIRVQTSTPAEVMCAAALEPFEVAYTLDTSDLSIDTYTLDVNGSTETLTLTADDLTITLTCPQATEDTLLFDDNGLCFLYPANYDVLSDETFIFINQPLTNNPFILIDISDADETTLDEIIDDTDSDDVLVDEIVVGGVDGVLIETDDTRELVMIIDEQFIQFILQPLLVDETIDDLLWSTIIDSIFFPIADEATSTD